ncbi:MAG: response regulator transcription factor [Actinomycetota bacterium]
MGEQRVRVMVGEGQTARKGLLRFVLENEGYDVVAEATSTLELAQRLVIHRPDVVVLDEGIDASAVGMMREVLPSAKVILVWPRGVAAVGVEARLEPSEVMTSLGSTVARVVGRGPVIAPPRPRVAPPDVIVVPEPEAPTEQGVPPEVQEEAREKAREEGPASAGSAGPSADVEEEVTDVTTGPEDTGRTIVVPESLPNVLMRPADIATPTWTYTAARAGATGDRRRRITVVVLAVVAGLLAIALGASLLSTGTVRTQIVSGSLGGHTLPGSGGQPGQSVTTDQPGTFEGIVHVRADGSIRLRASGDIRLRIDGFAHIVASGDVKVSGDGVVNNVSSAKVRVRGNGTIRIVVGDGHIRLRLQGTVTGRGKGIVRIGGLGRFVITHRPV